MIFSYNNMYVNTVLDNTFLSFLPFHIIKDRCKTEEVSKTEPNPNLQYAVVQHQWLIRLCVDYFCASSLATALAGGIMFSDYLPVHLSHSCKHDISRRLEGRLAQMSTWTRA